MKRYYFGIYKKGGGKVFSTSKRVTEKSFPFYEKVLGPMHSKENAEMLAAMYYEKYGRPKKRKRNPGAAYRKRGAEGWESSRRRARSLKGRMYSMGARDAHRQSMEEAERLGMRNPRRARFGRRNPGAAWHDHRARLYNKRASDYPFASPTRRFYLGAASAEELARGKSEELGLRNPCRGNPCRHRQNPAVGTEIYDRITAIEATKGPRSLFPRERFRHDFKQGGKIIGLPNGDLLIKKRGKRLWKNFDYS